MPETRTAVDVRSATPTTQLVIQRTLKAAPERVFDAFTDPDQLKQWWWPKGFVCPAAEVDLRVGGTYRLAMEWPDVTPAEAQFAHYMGGEMGIETVQAVGPLDVGAPEPVAHCVQALELKARGAALAVAGPTDEAGPF